MRIINYVHITIASISFASADPHLAWSQVRVVCMKIVHSLIFFLAHSIIISFPFSPTKKRIVITFMALKRYRIKQLPWLFSCGTHSFINFSPWLHLRVNTIIYFELHTFFKIPLFSCARLDK